MSGGPVVRGGRDVERVGRLLGGALAVLLVLVGLPAGVAQAAGVYDTIPESDLRNLVTAMDAYAGFDSPDGTYRGVTAQALADEGWVRTSTDAVTIEVLSDGQDFGAFAQDVRGSSEFAFRRYGPGSYRGVGVQSVGLSSPQPAQPATTAALRIVDGGTVSGDGPTLKDETAGGSNPSEECSSRCHGDPVNAVTGEFFESAKDLSVVGVGPGLSFSRSYGSSVAGRAGTLGFGWRSNYAMAVEMAPGATGTGLADASQLLVRQENSSAVAFTRAPDGTLGAPPRVRATLTRQPDGTFTFLRRPDQLFTFSAAGVLQKVADLNGNTTALTYTAAGRLDRATGLGGSYLQFDYDTAGRVVQVADSTGRKVIYGYDAAGGLASVTDVLGGVTTFAYGAGHLLTSATDPRGAVTTTSYDARSRVVSQRDPLGRTTTWAYATGTSAGVPTGTTTITDPAGSVTVERHADARVTSETVASGTAAAATTSHTYDVTNHLATVTDSLGAVTTHTYDARGNRTSTTDPLGRVTTWAYTQPGDRVSRTVDPTGAVTANTYDARGNLTSTTDPTGATTTQTVNANGTVATVTDPRGNVPGATAATYTTRHGYGPTGLRTSTTGPDGARTTVTCDALGRPVTLTDPRGNVAGATTATTAAYSTAFAYDAAGRTTSRTDPTGATVTTTYDAVGHPLTITDGLGRVIRYSYDLAGQATTTTDPTGAVTTTAYDGAGRVSAVTDPRGKTTTTGYDAAGHATSTTTPLGLVTRTGYDLAGRPTTVTRPDGATTTTGYDKAGQAATVTDPLGKVTTTTYDLAGRPTRTVDPDGRATTTGYDKAGRPTSTTRADTSVLASGYDVAGNVTSTTDAAGGTTRYTYDGSGRQGTATDPLSRVTGTAYDPAGNVISVTAPDNQVTRRTIDAVNRITAVDHPGSTPDAGYTYDKAGQRTVMTDGTGSTTYGYDKAGRVTSTARTTTGASTATTVTYGYDTTGRLSALGYPGGSRTSRGYDDDNRLTSVTDGAGRVSTFTWDTGGHLASATYPNGVKTTTSYTAADQLATSATAKSTTSLLALGYTYSPSGLTTQATATGAATANAPPQTYSYDPLRRLASVTGAPGAGTVTFDAADNLTAKPTTGTATYDAAGQLLRRTAPGGATTDYTYDGRGNRTAATPTATPAQVTKYSYDTADRVTQLTAPAGTSTYRYDGDGLLAATSRTAGGTTTDTTLTWDTGTLAGGLPVLLADGTRDYLYGPDGQPYAQITRSTGGVLYLHRDALGSIRAITDAGGAVTGASSYDAYGNRTKIGTGGSTSAFGYAGEYTDAAGLVYLRARNYDPVTGTFLTRDPLVAQTRAPYSYAGGNPISNTDPSGLCFGLGDGGCPGADLLYQALQTGVGRAATSTLVGIGDGFTGGLTASLRERISPGSSCTFSHNGFYYAGGAVGFAAVTYATTGVGGARIAVEAAGDAGRVAVGPGAEKSWKVLDQVTSKGSPLPGYKGGSVFKNGDGRLPSSDGAGNPLSYREWDVNPHVKGVDRGPERLVTGSDGSAYHTGDHYDSFLQFWGPGG